MANSLANDLNEYWVWKSGCCQLGRRFLSCQMAVDELADHGFLALLLDWSVFIRHWRCFNVSQWSVCVEICHTFVRCNQRSAPLRRFQLL